ncbi:hypothetical protein [Bradyrhizobium sp. sGM-13]|nr:hypothetical protein [Bradyrhizobium sp. sGM-13]
MDWSLVIAIFVLGAVSGGLLVAAWKSDPPRIKDTTETQTGEVL